MFANRRDVPGLSPTKVAFLALGPKPSDTVKFTAMERRREAVPEVTGIDEPDRSKNHRKPAAHAWLTCGPLKVYIIPYSASLSQGTDSPGYCATIHIIHGKPGCTLANSEQSRSGTRGRGRRSALGPIRTLGDKNSDSCIATAVEHNAAKITG